MLRIFNILLSPRRRAGSPLCALLFFFLIIASPEAHGFGKKPVVVPPVTPPPVVIKPPVTPPTDPSEIVRARWEAKQRDGVAWSKHVFEQLPVLAPRLLANNPADIAQFCPAYSSLSATDKKNFWVYLISSMAELESGHDPAVTYTEAFADVNGKRVVSRGLLQISIESGNAYGCAFKTEAELHDPERNLDCGLRILNKWVGNDGTLAGQKGTAWQGGARYWSVLRKDPNLGKIKAWNNALRMCAN